MLIKQRTVALRADCFSSDLQQVNVEVRVLYSVPEASVVQLGPRITVEGDGHYDVLVGRGLVAELPRALGEGARRVALVHPVSRRDTAARMAAVLAEAGLEPLLLPV